MKGEEIKIQYVWNQLQSKALFAVEYKLITHAFSNYRRRHHSLAMSKL